MLWEVCILRRCGLIVDGASHESLYPTQKYHETHQVDQHISSPADYHQFYKLIKV